MKDSRGSSRARWVRFVIGGAINTAVTYLLYLALNIILPYQMAYLMAYAIGIVFAYWFNAVVVFHVQPSWVGFLSFPAVYVIQYLSSALLLAFVIEVVGLREDIAPLLVAVTVAPMTYVLTKFVLKKSSVPRTPRSN